MIISHYMTRSFRGNPVHAPVHLFANDHDHRSLSCTKRHLTATVYESFAKQQDGSRYQVLLASSNSLLSSMIETEHGARSEVMPISGAKHLAQLMGIGLVVLDSAQCDVRTYNTWWDLYFFMPDISARSLVARELLLGTE